MSVPCQGNCGRELIRINPNVLARCFRCKVKQRRENNVLKGRIKNPEKTNRKSEDPHIRPGFQNRIFFLQNKPELTADELKELITLTETEQGVRKF